jgi:hypothetical protein
LFISPQGLRRNTIAILFIIRGDEIGAMAKLTDLSVEFIGEWNHPRGQQMLAFSL